MVHVIFPKLFVLLTGSPSVLGFSVFFNVVINACYFFTLCVFLRNIKSVN